MISAAITLDTDKALSDEASSVWSCNPYGHFASKKILEENSVLTATTGTLPLCMLCKLSQSRKRPGHFTRQRISAYDASGTQSRKRPERLQT